ncbi:MAG TPA: AAA family ATPase [Polyangiaceae bacterium]|nr:AAA family ATPase [Polyangiaceae bacterium]
MPRFEALTFDDVADVEKELADAVGAKERLREALGRVVVGQDAVLEEVLWALVAGGHVLLEGAPGLGKTLIVRTLAACLDLKFSRIQFTPDLMPSDVLGASVLVLDASGRSSGRFELHRGPIFGQLVLADEINRAPPKTQSALLEAMQEHAVTIAGSRQILDEPFMVLATENPIEMEGTYPLPEAQLDRFLVKVVVPTPSEDDLVRILERTTTLAEHSPEPVLRGADVLALRALCRKVVVAEPVMRYVARLVAATDPSHPTAPDAVKRAVRYGASVRGAQAVTLTAKAVALFDGRAHVALADIAKVALPSLRHRIIRSFEGEAAGISADAIVASVLAAVPSRPEAVEKAARSQ